MLVGKVILLAMPQASAEIPLDSMTLGPTRALGLRGLAL